ncbi:hypothetical protein BBJ28_00025482, partial [Nothophytophthora sp. Chile5]
AGGEDGPHGTRTLQREAFFEIWATVRQLASQYCASFGMEHLDSLVKAVVLREDASTLTLGGNVLLLQAPSEMRAGTAPTDDDFAVPVMVVSRGDQPNTTGALLGKRSRSASGADGLRRPGQIVGQERSTKLRGQKRSRKFGGEERSRKLGGQERSLRLGGHERSRKRGCQERSRKRGCQERSSEFDGQVDHPAPALQEETYPRAAGNASDGDAAGEEEEEEEVEDDEDDEADDLPPSPPKKPTAAKSYPPSKKKPAKRKTS